MGLVRTLEPVVVGPGEIWCYRRGRVQTHRECVAKQIECNERIEGGLCSRCPIAAVAAKATGIWIGPPQVMQ